MLSQEDLKKLVGYKAADFVEDGSRIGLGTGSTAKYVVLALGERVAEGMKIEYAVPTSDATKELAESVGIQIKLEPEAADLAVTIDGADQIDLKTGLCIKGGGGAHFLEKKVATKSQKLIIIVDESKLVDSFDGYKLPLEVREELKVVVEQELKALGYKFSFRAKKSDSGNLICDVVFESGDIRLFAREMMSIEGVLDTGLFEDLTSMVVVGKADGTVEVVEY